MDEQAVNKRTGQASRYLDHLPAIFQQDATPDTPNFLGRFLLAFEQVLTGLGDAADPGLEEILDGIRSPTGGKWLRGGVQRYFSPLPYLPGDVRAGPPDEFQAPKEFLEWLAGWVALSLRADLDEAHKRDLIARAVPLYRLRGTKQGLAETIRLYGLLGATIDELNTSFQIGTHSTIGVDTLLDGGAPHFFHVLIRLPIPDPALISRHRQIATAIIDAEKPAHTFYTLLVETPTLQIGKHSTVGIDTLLGEPPQAHR